MDVMKYLFLIILPLLLFTCSPQKRTSVSYAHETECMGTELDGSQTLKAWGTGRNRWDAVDQAKKNAIRDVIFKGIRNGQPDCNTKPLIVEVNAQEKYEDYFHKFFTDDGLYADFISQKDESILPKIFKERKAAGSEVVFGVIIRVLRAELKQQLIKDKILKG